MAEDLNVRGPQRKTTSTEDDLNGKRPQRKTTSMEDDLKGRWPERKTTFVSFVSKRYVLEKSFVLNIHGKKELV